MNKKGFTLIELLVVIAIIGILATVVLTSLSGARSKARDARRMSDVVQVISAQEMYYNANNESYLTASSPENGLPAVGTYLPATDDPQAPTKHYKWLDNQLCVPAGQFFCAYATLESKGSCVTAQYFVSSEKGTKIACDTAPAYTGGGTICTCY